jgi:predicted ATP-grasp superfamily ATP-dependent carboligase
MNVLVANAKSPPGLAVIRSLGRKGIEVTGASDSSRDFPLFSKYCRKKILLRNLHHSIDERIDELYSIVKNNRFDVFLPVMQEKFLLALSKRKGDFEKHTRLALPPFDQLNILNNKATVSSLLAELGIPHPTIYPCDSETDLEAIQRKASFPLIIKPHRGEGAKGVKIIPDPENLKTHYYDSKRIHGTVLIQDFINGTKHTAAFILNKQSEVRRFFVHRAIREYPLSGGPTCFLQSVKYEPILEYGLKLLKAVNFSGLASMEFVIDRNDDEPKIIDVNPRFYGPIQCAISAGVDLPYDVFRMALQGDIETDLAYKEGITCRNLLFEDTKHMLSVMKGVKSPKYTLGKTATLLNYLNFFRDDSYFILSLSDPMPAIRKILN